jgi:hypothetical protein
MSDTELLVNVLTELAQGMHELNESMERAASVNG